MMLTKKEINNLKREVKKVTNMNLKDIEEIQSYGNDFIVYGYYETNYDRVTNNMTYREIKREK